MSWEKLANVVRVRPPTEAASLTYAGRWLTPVSSADDGTMHSSVTRCAAGPVVFFSPSYTRGPAVSARPGAHIWPTRRWRHMRPRLLCRSRRYVRQHHLSGYQRRRSKRYYRDPQKEQMIASMPPWLDTLKTGSLCKLGQPEIQIRTRARNQDSTRSRNLKRPPIGAAYFKALETVPNVFFRFVPAPCTTAMIAMEMPAAMRPYSMAVAPDFVLRKALVCLAMPGT